MNSLVYVLEMVLSPPLIQDIARSLWEAQLQGKPCPPLSQSFPTLEVADAYLVSKTSYERKLKNGERPLGKKIGLTSAAVQKQLGVDQPDFGYLTSNMVLEHGRSLGPKSLIQGRVEGEVAFVLKSDLQGPGITPAEVLHATDFVVACIEIIDSRIQDWKIKIQDTIADNASSAFFVLGNIRRKPSEIDLRMAGMTLRLNGEVESTGVGAACLGHPVNAVAWLANILGSLGEKLSAGDIILSGAYGPVVPFREGNVCEVEISGLGKVSCGYAIQERH